MKFEPANLVPPQVKHLGMGHVTYVYLKFPSNFWGDKLLQTYADEEPGVYLNYINYDKVVPGSNTLLVISDKSTESKSKEQIKADVMLRLKQMFGEAIPDPIDLMHSTWATNPYTQGSWTFYGLNPEGNVVPEIEA